MVKTKSIVRQQKIQRVMCARERDRNVGMEKPNEKSSSKIVQFDTKCNKFEIMILNIDGQSRRTSITSIDDLVR